MLELKSEYQTRGWGQGSREVGRGVFQVGELASALGLRQDLVWARSSRRKQSDTSIASKSNRSSDQREGQGPLQTKASPSLRVQTEARGEAAFTLTSV